MSITWLVPELDDDFSEDFEDTIIQYIFDKWSILVPAKGSNMKPDYESEPDTVSFKPGFPDFFRPYEICCVQTRTLLLEKIDGKHVFTTGLDVMIRMKRIERDAIDTEPQLENMENEVQRIIENYEGEIVGIKDLVYDENPSVQRVYNGTDNWAKSDWRSVVRIKVFYEKEDVS